MSLKDAIIQLQDRLELAMKNFRYNSTNRKRDALVNERMEYVDCKAKLNQSLSLFKTTIRKQALHIQEGEFYGRDTKVQEDELWSAALGYMLVQDAQFQLKSVYNIDTISYAHDLLKGVERYMEGGRPNFPKVLGVNRERNKAGFLLPEHVIRDRNELLGTFFDKLKRTGDIEGCLKEARMQRRQAHSGKATMGGSGGGSLMERRKQISAEAVEEEEILTLNDDYLSVDVPNAPLVEEAEAMEAAEEVVEEIEEYEPANETVTGREAEE